MTIETEKFVITSVDPTYSQSREITANPKPPQKTGIKVATVFCKNCENLWNAQSSGEGKFCTAFGSFIFKCPNCPAEEVVQASVVMNIS